MADHRRLLLTPRARDGVAATIEFVEDRFGAALALDVHERFLAELRRLAQFPGLGHQRRDLTADETVRFRTLGPALIAYRETELGIEIPVVERAERDGSTLVD